MEEGMIKIKGMNLTPLRKKVNYIEMKSSLLEKNYVYVHSMIQRHKK